MSSNLGQRWLKLLINQKPKKNQKIWISTKKTNLSSSAKSNSSTKPTCNSTKINQLSDSRIGFTSLIKDGLENGKSVSSGMSMTMLSIHRSQLPIAIL